MAHLNFKHLRYFWMVAKSGSIAGASQRLHLTPQSISGQLGELEASLGVELFRRVGRIEAVTEQLYAITTERRLLHPAIVAVVQATQRELFGKPALGRAGDRRE